MKALRGCDAAPAASRSRRSPASPCAEARAGDRGLRRPAAPSRRGRPAPARPLRRRRRLPGRPRSRRPPCSEHNKPSPLPPSSLRPGLRLRPAPSPARPAPRRSPGRRRHPRPVGRRAPLASAACARPPPPLPLPRPPPSSSCPRRSVRWLPAPRRARPCGALRRAPCRRAVRLGRAGASGARVGGPAGAGRARPLWRGWRRPEGRLRSPGAAAAAPAARRLRGVRPPVRGPFCRLGVRSAPAPPARC